MVRENAQLVLNLLLKVWFVLFLLIIMKLHFAVLINYLTSQGACNVVLCSSGRRFYFFYIRSWLQLNGMCFIPHLHDRANIEQTSSNSMCILNAFARCLPDRVNGVLLTPCLLYTSPSPRDRTRSRMPSSA